MHARLEGLEPRNMSNLDVKGEAPDQADELDPSVVRALATRLFTVTLRAARGADTADGGAYRACRDTAAD